MRRQLGEGFAEIEIVAEFGAGFSLAIADPRGEASARPHLLAQRADEIGVLGEPLDQNGARTVKRGGHVRHLLFGVDESGGGRLRLFLRVRQQQVGERLQSGFLGDLGLGASLRLIGEIDVLKAPLAVGSQYGRLEGGIELALLADRVEDDRAPFLQLAQIMQPLFERAQLRVVQRAGRLLAIARDERHRRTTIEQSHGGFDLLLANAERFRDLPMNGCRHARTSCRRRLRPVNRNRPRSPTGSAYGRSAVDSSTPAETRAYIVGGAAETIQFAICISAPRRYRERVNIGRLAKWLKAP